MLITREGNKAHRRTNDTEVIGDNKRGLREIGKEKRNYRQTISTRVGIQQINSSYRDEWKLGIFFFPQNVRSQFP